MEKLKGSIGIKTKERELTNLSTDISLLFNQARRNIFLSLDKKKGLFSGKMSLAWFEETDTAKPTEQTKLDFNLSGLKLSADGDLQTKEPVHVSLTSNYSADLKVTALSGTLNGELSCQLFDTCTYRLDKPATLSTKSIIVRDQGYEVSNKSRFQVMLEPTQKLIDVAFKTGMIDFDFNTKDFVAPYTLKYGHGCHAAVLETFMIPPPFSRIRGVNLPHKYASARTFTSIILALCAKSGSGKSPYAPNPELFMSKILRFLGGFSLFFRFFSISFSISENAQSIFSK